MTNTKDFRSLMLCVLGWIAGLIAPVTVFFVHAVHSLPFLDSISESATILQTSMILPGALILLAAFGFVYAATSSYDLADRIIPCIMSTGFLLVAFQPCDSDYIIDKASVGLFGVSERVSEIIHYIGAITGFGALILWIMLCFVKTDPTRKPTDEKMRRNNIYYTLGWCMIASLGVFIVNIFIRIPHVIFFAEALMLTPFAAPACIIKSGRGVGHLLADKKPLRYLGR